MRNRIFIVLSVLVMFVFMDQMMRSSRMEDLEESLRTTNTFSIELNKETTTEYFGFPKNLRFAQKPQSLGVKQKRHRFQSILSSAIKLKNDGLESMKLGANLTSKVASKKIIIVSTWRSGSTFLGDLIHSLPLSWYHYEPLNVLGIKQVRSMENPSVSWISSLLNCNYTKLEKYISYLRRVPDLYNYNKEWRSICKTKFNKGCLEPGVLHQMCSLYPFQVLKTVRLRLRLLRSLFKDKTVKIIYLVRDPRGTFQSRKHREWCPSSPDCSKPENLCSDLVDDFKTATVLKSKFPKQFFVVRYEVFSSDVQKSSEALFKDLSLPWHSSVQKFIQEHTRQDFGGPWSTFRDSKVAPFHWIKELSRLEVNQIQMSCARPLKMWGYLAMSSNSSKESFHPVIGDWSLL